MGSSFTLTLANIFMWKWEKESICKDLPSFEIYGRYALCIKFSTTTTTTNSSFLSFSF